MHASKMIDRINKNSRLQEGILNDAKQALSSAHAEELQLQAEILAHHQLIAEKQLDFGLPFEIDVRNQIALRKNEEAALRVDLSKTEALVEKCLKEHSDMAQQLNALESSNEARLKINPEYIRLQAERLLATQSASAAKLCFDEIDAECKTKLAGFDHPLYRYLRTSGYGTNDYSGRHAIRYLDGLIANICNFRENRESEAMLLALSKENALAFSARNTQAKTADALLDRVRKESPEFAAIAALRDALGNIKTEIANAKKKANATHKELSRYAANEDDRYIKARDLLAAAMASLPPDALLVRVQQTEDKTDDAALQKIISLQKRIQENASRVETLTAQHKDAAANYRRAKEIERTLRDDRYTSSRYEYNRSLDIDSLIVGYMAGQISHESIVGKVTESRTRIPDPEPEPEPEPPAQESSPWSSGGSGDSDSIFSTSDSDSISTFSTSDSF